MIKKKKFVRDISWISLSAILSMATLCIVPHLRVFVSGLLMMNFGVLLNMVTMWYNKGKMPVLIKENCLGHLDDAQIAKEETETHFYVRNIDNVKFKFLIDRINFGCSTNSLGDVVMKIGGAIAVTSGMFIIYSSVV